MSNFVVFTYQFCPINDDSLTLFKDEVDPLQSMLQKNQIFDSIMKDDTFVILYRNSQFQRLPLYDKNGVYVFRLANKRYIRVEKNFQSNKIENHPSILIIIDNREDKQRILIEERIGAFYDEEYVARILQNSFRTRLVKHKLHIIISKEYQSKEFWEVITGYDNGVEKIRFAFPYPNLSRIKDSMKSLISDINASTNSKDTRFELNAAKGETLQINQKDDNIVGLVEAAAGSGQGIVIKAKGFKHQQTVGNTKKIVAIDEFEGQFPEIALAKIIEKLDTIK